MNPIGRPTLTKIQIDLIFHKLEPHIKTGLSINKACIQARIPKSTVYELCSTDGEFAERINTAKNYHAVLTTSIITKELERIAKTQNNGKQITLSDIKYVQWCALNCKGNKEEFGEDKGDLQAETEELKFDKLIFQDHASIDTLIATYQIYRKRAFDSEGKFIGDNINIYDRYGREEGN